MTRRLFCVVSLLACTGLALGQDDPLAPVKLRVRPAAAPSPALKYQLLPELKDMTHGNGAIQYYRSCSPEWLTHRRQPDWDKFLDYLTMPLKELPRAKLQWLLTYRPLKELDVASRKETCDWDLAERVRQEGIGLWLPDMQKFREMAALLAVKARLQIAEGHYDDAVYTLQTGLLLGKRVGEAPILVCHLIGVAICDVMLAQLEELLQAPDAPNFYWALTNLPHPLVDMRKSLEGERLSLISLLPQLPDLEAALRARKLTPLSPDQEKALLASVTNMLGVALYDRPSDVHAEENRLALTGLCLKAYPEAKKALLAQGYPAKEIDDLPVVQVVTLRSVQVFQQLQDDLVKWFGLPYAERREGIERAERQMREARARLDVLPLYALLPAVSKVSFAQARLERRLAALRCVEAVRMYAAAHDGKPPASLAAITDVPVPLDPITGKAFDYKSTGDKVNLFGPQPGKEPRYPYNILSYELTFVR